MDNATSIWAGTITGPWKVGLTNSRVAESSQSGTLMTPSPLGAFGALQTQWSTLKPSGTPLSKYTSTRAAPSCPTSLPGKDFDPHAPPPTLGVSVLPASLLSRLSGAATTTPAPGAPVPGGEAPDPTGGLSTGKKVAIGVVIPVITLTVIFATYLLWRRRKNGQTRQLLAKPPMAASPGGK